MARCARPRRPRCLVGSALPGVVLAPSRPCAPRSARIVRSCRLPRQRPRAPDVPGRVRGTRGLHLGGRPAARIDRRPAARGDRDIGCRGHRSRRAARSTPGGARSRAQPMCVSSRSATATRRTRSRASCCASRASTVPDLAARFADALRDQLVAYGAEASPQVVEADGRTIWIAGRHGRRRTLPGRGHPAGRHCCCIDRPGDGAVLAMDIAVGPCRRSRAPARWLRPRHRNRSPPVPGPGGFP